MKRFKLDARLFWFATAALALLIAAGCGDDPVTPNEQPVITEEDAATQGAFIAVGMVEVLDDLAATKAVPGIETVSGSSYITGSYWLDSDPDHVYTDAEHRLTIDFDGPANDDILPATLLFDVTATGTPRLANGTGSLLAGALTITFVVSSIEVAADNYPTGGQLIVSTSGYTATIEFFSNHSATVTVGDLEWSVDLEDGDITPAD
ncbi:MAG: hypothetical protein Q7W56_05915 [Candidatus Latescibacteria bacterium]|nr:hypothetical protein [Candidatus Latescibacterota bacterium]